METITVKELLAATGGKLLQGDAAAKNFGVNTGSRAGKAGEVLLILEAMKTENEIVAPCDGTVKQRAVQNGSTVAPDALLAVVG